MADGERAMRGDEIIRKVLRAYGIDDDYLANGIFLEVFVVEDVFGRMTPGQRADLRQMSSELDQLAFKLNELEESGSWISCRYGGVLDNASDAMLQVREILRAELDRSPPERKRPTTEHGEMSIRLFKMLQDAGITGAWRCSRIIAEILVSTDQSKSPTGNLTKALYYRLSRL